MHVTLIVPAKLTICVSAPAWWPVLFAYSGVYSMSRIGKFFALLVVLTLSFGVLLHSFQSQQLPINRWLAMGKMQTARAGACSVPLSDGRVLITDGEGPSGILNSAEVFDSSGEFTAVAPMSRADHACVTLDGGRVLVAGGKVSGGGSSNVAEIYGSFPGRTEIAASPHLAAQRPSGDWFSGDSAYRQYGTKLRTKCCLP